MRADRAALKTVVEPFQAMVGVVRPSRVKVQNPQINLVGSAEIAETDV